MRNLSELNTRIVDFNVAYLAGVSFRLRHLGLQRSPIDFIGSQTASQAAFRDEKTPDSHHVGHIAHRAVYRALWKDQRSNRMLGDNEDGLLIVTEGNHDLLRR